MDQIPEEPTEVATEASTEEAIHPALLLPDFLTIRWDSDGDVELDIGGLSPWESKVLLQAAVNALGVLDPVIYVRSNGHPIIGFADLEDEDDEEEEFPEEEE